MKKLLLYSIAALIAAPALAELPADGYYRVQSAYTKRYAYLLDNKGSINVGSTSVDVGALKLYKETPEMFSDPATVFYVEHSSTGKYKYDISGQGTSVYKFLDQYLDIMETRKPYEGREAFLLSGTDSGAVTKYIGDIWTDLSSASGLASSEAQGDYRNWYLNPISADSEQYFGAAPTVEAAGKYYCPMFAGFPMSAYSEGIRFYVVKEIDSRGVAVIEEVKGTLPAATPVIIECSSDKTTDNRLNVGGDSQSAVGVNCLKGVYFNIDDNGRHVNRTPFNKQTMRVLGLKDGKPAFVEGDFDYVPRNQAYLQLTNPNDYAVKNFVLMTEEQRDAELGAVSLIPESTVVDVYTPDGRLVKAGIAKEEVGQLGRGLYILRGAGVSEKVIVN